MDARIVEIASKVDTPLGIAGLSVAVLYLLYSTLLKRTGLFTKLKETHSFDVINQILRYLFILALVSIVLAFAAFVYVKVAIAGTRIQVRGAVTYDTNDPARGLRVVVVGAPLGGTTNETGVFELLVDRSILRRDSVELLIGPEGSASRFKRALADTPFTFTVPRPAAVDPRSTVEGQYAGLIAMAEDTLATADELLAGRRFQGAAELAARMTSRLDSFRSRHPNFQAPSTPVIGGLRQVTRAARDSLTGLTRATEALTATIRAAVGRAEAQLSTRLFCEALNVLTPLLRRDDSLSAVYPDYQSPQNVVRQAQSLSRAAQDSIIELRRQGRPVTCG